MHQSSVLLYLSSAVVREALMTDDVPRLGVFPHRAEVPRKRKRARVHVGRTQAIKAMLTAHPPP